MFSKLDEAVAAIETTGTDLDRWDLALFGQSPQCGDTDIQHLCCLIPG